jgi:hypothetical protein
LKINQLRIIKPAQKNKTKLKEKQHNVQVVGCNIEEYDI